MEELVFQLSTVVVVAVVLAMMAHRFKQPLVVAYMLTGLLLGSAGFNFITDVSFFGVFSRIGVAFLLFTVGLGLHWRKVREVGMIAVAAGVGQVVLTALATFGIGSLLGFNMITSLYLAAAFTFSSTIIVVKVLTDKEEADTLYGKISIGILLVQDFIAMLLLLGLGAWQGGGTLPQIIGGTFVKGVLCIPAFYLISTYILPPALRFVAKSQELLLLFSIGLCLLVSYLLTLLGFSMEMGALAAGVLLAGTLYEKEILSRIQPLRDFFLAVFFIMLGASLHPDALTQLFVPTFVFSLFILLVKPLILVPLMHMLGYHPRTGFLTGTTMAQVSEFSFIVLTLGVGIGQIQEQTLSLAAAVGLFTIAVSSTFLTHNHQMYEVIRPLMRWLERLHGHPLPVDEKPLHPSIYLLGYHRVGHEALETIKQLGKTFAVVDFDPRVVSHLKHQNIHALYGDVGDDVFLDEIRMEKALCIVSTIPDTALSLSLLTYLEARSYKGSVIVTVKTAHDARLCYAEGATYVIVPNLLGGTKFRELLEQKKTRKSAWLLQAKKDGMIS